MRFGFVWYWYWILFHTFAFVDVRIDLFVCAKMRACIWDCIVIINGHVCVQCLWLDRRTQTICQSISTTHVRLGSLTHSLLTITLPRIFHLYCEIAVDFNVDVARDYVLFTPKVFRFSALSNKSSSFLFCFFFFRISVDRTYHLWFFFFLLLHEYIYRFYVITINFG